MPKVSDGRSVRVGLVGPKARPKGVVDGHPVNIPEPAVERSVTRLGSSASYWIEVVNGVIRDAGAFEPQVSGPSRQEKPQRIKAAARTANRHR